MGAEFREKNWPTAKDKREKKERPQRQSARLAGEKNQKEETSKTRGKIQTTNGHNFEPEQIRDDEDDFDGHNEEEHE